MNLPLYLQNDYFSNQNNNNIKYSPNQTVSNKEGNFLINNDNNNNINNNINLKNIYEGLDEDYIDEHQIDLNNNNKI